MKLGGIVSISFWSMVIIVLSGVVGRFIYLQIPRTLEGRELTLQELQNMKQNLSKVLQETHKLSPSTIEAITQYTTFKKTGNPLKSFMRRQNVIKNIKNKLKEEDLTRTEIKEVIRLSKEEILFSRKIERLNTMKNLFKNWHIMHLPFAFIMLFIMIIHVIITLTFGYRWIF